MSRRRHTPLTVAAGPLPARVRLRFALPVPVETLRQAGRSPKPNVMLTRP